MPSRTGDSIAYVSDAQRILTVVTCLKSSRTRWTRPLWHITLISMSFKFAFEILPNGREDRPFVYVDLHESRREINGLVSAAAPNILRRRLMRSGPTGPLNVAVEPP
jgi:hypothetical protein